MNHVYDVAVVGAGPGGSAAAHYLARAGLDVLLLDKSDFPRDKTCGDGLTPRALGVLQDMGILGRLEQSAYRINGLEFISKSGKRLTAPAKTNSPYPDYLLVLPRLEMDAIIRQRALDSGAKFIGDSRVIDIQEEGDPVSLLTQRGGQSIAYSARVAIVATGANTGLLLQIGLLTQLPEPMLAVRGYFEGVRGLSDRVQIHFMDAVLPGYGWVFPISATAANIGVGLWQVGPHKKQKPLRGSMDGFLADPLVKQQLADAKQVGPLKSFPLRSDFVTAPTVKGRVLALGEAVGLVNPLTGEGIDFALESGRIAAEFLTGLFAQGKVNPEAIAQYDRLLRLHFQSIFRYFSLLRTMLRSPVIMQSMFTMLEKSQRVKRIAVDILMSQPTPLEILHLKARTVQ
ncbi:MAG: geranylgeranyl reductase family protein [Anaerolineales bacterium]